MSVTLTFNVLVESGVSAGTIISNVAWLQELSGPGPRFSVMATNIVAGYDIYLPIAFKND